MISSLVPDPLALAFNANHRFASSFAKVLSLSLAFPSTIEILYAFNDDGRRILDNNFHSHRANNKRMGSSVSEIYFGSMIQERGAVTLPISLLTSREKMFICMS